MPIHRLADVEPFGIEAVAKAAGTDPDVLRLENLDTDLPPPPAAVAATRQAVGQDDANSYLPFTGLAVLREAVAQRLTAQTGRPYDPDTELVISSGGLAGVLSTLLATADAWTGVNRLSRYDGRPALYSADGATVRRWDAETGIPWPAMLPGETP
jgi:aspartate/methionine/tyrosine aminotransferase